jgi:hypothetical protein
MYIRKFSALAYRCSQSKKKKEFSKVFARAYRWRPRAPQTIQGGRGGPTKEANLQKHATTLNHSLCLGRRCRRGTARVPT